MARSINCGFEQLFLMTWASKGKWAWIVVGKDRSIVSLRDIVGDVI